MKIKKLTTSTSRHFSKKIQLHHSEHWGCCDCGLMHEYRFYSDKPDTRLWYRVRRHVGLTKKLRGARKHRKN